MDKKFQDLLIEKAKELGFDSVGFTNATVPQRNQERLKEFIEGGQYGEMEWMREKADRRMSPDKMWAEVKSAIVLGMNYGPDYDPMENLKDANIGNISVYARNRDYHEIIKGKLKNLAQWIVSYSKKHNNQSDVKVFVDTAPLMEKALASQTSVGWMGKHSVVVNREFGNWLFLGEILTTMEIIPDEPANENCGSCNNCIVSCPTGAIFEDGKLDARKCISYLTIEHKGHIDEQYLEPIGNRIYGCDDCLSVCPWNKFANETNEERFITKPELQSPSLTELLNIKDDAEFRTKFSGSPIKRIGHKQFLRNVLIAVGNSKNTDYIPKIKQFLNDDNETVAKMANWATDKLQSVK
ncbi:MAG: tRNA epoxyqueuosine(34) reductase QueG [Alphaproteobacteria bacterium]